MLPPKLRAKGGETRHLVPFAFKLATEFDSHYNTVFSNTVASMLSYLLGFYLCMDKVPYDAGLANTLCRKLCLLYKALSDDPPGGEGRWEMNPKLHMFCELAEQSLSFGNPRDFWAYRDESFMGIIAKMAASRGGGGIASTVPLQTMERWIGLCDKGLD